MTWRQVNLTCRSADLAQVETLLLELGALSISLRDAGDEPIYEPLPGDSPVWRESVVSATFPGDCDPERLRLALEARLPPSLAATLSQDSFQDRDWELAYREHFKPIRCASRLWIVPSWLEPPDPGAINLRLDPGLAFGTGGHPTTALCLAWLAEQDLQGIELVDYGCGSGILAIAAVMLGAAHAVAIDIDQQALDACRSNMAMNSISPARIRCCLPRDAGNEKVDLLVANILAGPLVELAPRFGELLRPGAKILLSGILNSQLNEIQSAYERLFQLDPARRRGEWICVGGRRRER